MASKRSKWALAIGGGCLALCGLTGYVILSALGLQWNDSDAKSEMARARKNGIPLTAAEVNPAPADLTNANNAWVAIRSASLERDDTKELMRAFGEPIVGGELPSPRLPLELKQAYMYLGIEGQKLQMSESEARKKYWHPNWDLDDWSTPLPEYSWIRIRCHAHLIRAAIRARSGDHQGAFTDLETVEAWIAKLKQDPYVIGDLVAMGLNSMEGYGAAELADIWKRDARALERLQKFVDAPETLWDAKRQLLTDAYVSISVTRNLNKWGISIFHPTMFDARPQKVENAKLVRDGIPNDLLGKSFFCDTLRFWNDTAEACQPLVTTSEVATELNRRFKLLGAKESLFAKFLVSLNSDYSGIVIAENQSNAVHRAASALVAAQRYRLLNGRWPTSLSALGRTRIDPFDGKPLRMREEGGRLVIYSVGRDRKDNGGALPKVGDQRLHSSSNGPSDVVLASS